MANESASAPPAKAATARAEACLRGICGGSDGRLPRKCRGFAEDSNLVRSIRDKKKSHKLWSQVTSRAISGRRGRGRALRAELSYKMAISSSSSASIRVLMSAITISHFGQ